MKSNKEETQEEVSLAEYSEQLIEILVENKGLTYVEAKTVFDIASNLCMEEIQGSDLVEETEEITAEETTNEEGNDEKTV